MREPVLRDLLAQRRPDAAPHHRRRRHPAAPTTSDRSDVASLAAIVRPATPRR